jgi:ABC-type Fe3+ transport system substrate-binding protein
LPAHAQDVKAKGEAEGKLMMYATFTAADSKTLLDGFKQLYPKIDAAYYRSNDAALMERFVSENRAGQNFCDVIVTTSFYGNAIKKRGLFAPYDSPERKFFREGYKDPQAHWTSTYTNYGAFGYNTLAVAKNSVPRSFNDLLKPERCWTISNVTPNYSTRSSAGARNAPESTADVARIFRRME